MMKERKFLPTISELIDRLSIVQLKECKIPENKEEYAQEISDIVHDIQLIINETEQPITAEMIRATTTVVTITTVMVIVMRAHLEFQVNVTKAVPV